MEFGSKYVYTYTDSEEESVSDEEFEAGIDAVSCIPATSALSASHERDGSHSSASVRQTAARTVPPVPGRSKLHKWMFPTRSARGGGAPSSIAPEQSRADADRASPQIGKKWRRADTNVVAIKFDQLKKPSNMHTGDAVSCQRCLAMMSHLSSIREDGDEQVWECEFCEERNVVDILPEEIPKLDDVTYMLKPAPATTAASCGGVDESIIVFCVDISGSMCVSKQVDGRMKLRGSHADRYRSLNTTGETQWLPGESHNVTYITRLQALQAAVDHQLEQLAKEHPTRKAALISFNNEVQVIGDGTADPVVIAGDKLGDENELANIASSLALPTSIQTTRASLAEKLFELEEGGQTALGPALLVAIVMASKVRASKVVMCTDGLANVGLGNLDTDSADQHSEASSFYSQLGEKAKENGVTVSVLTIAGTDCKLVELGSVASETGGQVNIVDPLKLTEEFGNILANPVIASRVEATFIVHKGLYIREDADRSSCVKRAVGNVTADTEITFEYGIRRRTHDRMDTGLAADDDADNTAAATTADEESQPPTSETAEEMSSESEQPHEASANTTNTEPMEGTDTTAAAAAATEEVSTGVAMDTDATSGAAASTSKSPSELPFQVQITYTDLDGAEAVRVLTQTQPVTKDRHQAETTINMPVVGVHAAQQSSKMALEGQYTPSRLNAFMYQRLVARNTRDTEYDAYLQNLAPMENQLRDAQLVEARRTGLSVTRYENIDGSTSAAVSASTHKPRFGAKLSKLFSGGKPHSVPANPPQHLEYGKTMRRKTCSDEMSSELYSKKQVSSRMFTPREPSPRHDSDSSDED